MITTLHWVGFNPDSGWFPTQVIFLIWLAGILMIDSWRAAALAKEGKVSAYGVETIMTCMRSEQHRHLTIRAFYSLHVSKGHCTPWSTLRLFADTDGIKYHSMNGNHFFYHDKSGFMTVIPDHHIQANR